MRRWIALLLLSLAAFASGDARADAVDGPPSSCPPGSRGESSHVGPYCQLMPCSADADCGSASSDRERLVCADFPLCIGKQRLDGWGRWEPGDPVERDVAIGACGVALTCVAPAVCSTAKRCVPASKVTRLVRSVPPLPLAVAVLLSVALAGGLLLLLRRRPDERQQG